MRISDWSSDVCSSDLENERNQARYPAPSEIPRRRGRGSIPDRAEHRCGEWHNASHCPVRRTTTPYLREHRRSEEHTSELQSLMRISYAVFCLKKKKTQPNT